MSKPNSATAWLARIKPAFTLERTVARIIAAWCTFAAFTTVGKEGAYTDLSFAQDTSLVTMLLVMLLAFAVYAAVSVLLPRFETDTWFMLLASTVCVGKWLKTYDGKKETTLILVAVLAAYALFLFYFVQRNDLLFSIVKPDNRTAMIIGITCGVASAAVIAIITCLRYMTFSAPNFDFGLFVNMFHNMRETGLPNVTCERDMFLSHFAVHISPIYYLLLPFYYIFPSPLTLQIGQAVVLGSGVVPVLLLARHLKLSGKLQIAVAAIYALYPAISAGCFYDIHENCFLTPLLLWMFYFFEKEKYLGMYLSALGVLLVKEDAAMYIIMFAIFVLLGRKKLLHGGMLIAGALAYFAIALYLLDTFGDGVMVNRFDNLIFNKEDGLLGAVKTALVNPGFLLTQLFTTRAGDWKKLIYILQMFLPLGFLPFVTAKQSRWLLLAPMLMNLLTYYQYQYDIGFQYNFGVSAFLIYAFLLNLPDLKPIPRRNLVAIGAAACCCLYIVTVVPKLDSYVARWDKGKETYKQMDAILDTLPEDASLNISSMLLAHVADRDEIYEIKYHGNKPDVDYVVFDGRPGYYDDTAKQNRDAYLAHGYTLYEEHEGLVVILKSPNA